MGATTYNLAAGNARVGVQAGQIYGAVTVGPGPDRTTDLATEVAALRDLLKRAHRDGRLDDATYGAAETELAIASDCVKENTAQSWGTLLVALKRLRGLVADVAELAARLAAVIAVARDLS
jgi:adenosylhomocysteine nucleosidase